MRKAPFVLAGGAGVTAWAFTRRVRDRFRIAKDLRGPLTWLRGEAPIAPRRWVARMFGLIHLPLVRGVSVERHSVTAKDGAQLSVYVYRPEGVEENSPVLFYTHGGGMIIGSARMYHTVVSAYARQLGMIAVSTEYRLAPEHPYPTPLDDVAAAYAWVRAHAIDLGIDRDAIVVAGESAGGGLTAGLTLRLRDEGASLPLFQVLIYPMLDDRTCLQARPPWVGQVVWTPQGNRIGWSSYLGQAPGGGDVPVYAAPGRSADLTGLPPAWIGVGTLDLFHDEDVSYAEELHAAGVNCELREVEGAYHAFDVAYAWSSTGRAFRESWMGAIRRAISQRS